MKYYLILLMILLVASPVLAGERDPPHQYFGEVETNGEEAADGLLVVARIDGEDVAATSTHNGGFGYDPTFKIPDIASGRAGKLVVFYVQDEDGHYREGGSATYINGHSTQVDLDVEGDFDTGGSNNNGGGSGGGSGGSGGGSNNAPVTTTVQNDTNETGEPEDEIEIETYTTGSNTVCVEDWTCSDWLDCLSGKQKRICVDSNRCGTSDDRPVEVMECAVMDLQTSLDTEEKSKPLMNRITGAVTGAGAGTYTVLIIALLIVIGIAAFMLLRKK